MKDINGNEIIERTTLIDDSVRRYTVICKNNKLYAKALYCPDREYELCERTIKENGFEVIED